jgi:hypothetical protein
MKTLLSILCALALVGPANAKTKKITAAPEAPTVRSRTVASSISLHAQGTSSGAAAGGSVTQSGGARTTTTHSSGIQIGLNNLGAVPETVTVRWFWVGRYEKSRNFFRADDGEKAVTLDPKKSESILAEGGNIESHVTKGKTSEYKSGGHLLGWVVWVTNGKGELIAVRTSDTAYEGFVTAPPPKQR